MLFALLAVAYFLGRRDNGREERERQWRGRVEAALGKAGAYHDSLRAAEARERRFMQSFDSIGTVASTRRGLIARLRHDLAMRGTGSTPAGDRPSGTILDTIFAQQDSLVRDLAGQAETCRAAVITCQARASMAEARADSLTVLLRQGVKIGKCSVLFVKCPSRTTVAFGTAALTVVLLGVTGHLK